MMKYLFSIVAVVVAGLSFAAMGPKAPEGASVNVTQHHNNPSRDGLYIDPAFTMAAAANLTRDLSFNGTIVGNVYSQPLYVEGGPMGPVVIVATESNNVYALKVSDGTPLWQRNAGTPSTGMGNISPLGITGTPVIDLASRSLFFDAVISGPNNLIFSLNVDTGDINPGWPVDVNARISGFSSQRQSQRAALGLLGSTVYVPYGGYFGDAPTYFGRVLGVQINNPAATIGSYATTSTRAGIWGPGGIASDGTDLFVTTGNGAGGVTWAGSEAVIRLQPGPVFSNSTVDYFAPTNWASLDSTDSDLGGSGPVLVDVPGATPSALVVQFGKDGKAYLLNRNNLGGVSAPLASPSVGGNGIQAAATYRTAMGTYVVFRPGTNTLTAFRITATNPPTIVNAWSVSSSGRGSPFVTSTDGTNNVIVWAVGSSGDQRLHGHNGDTGAVVYNGGGASELMTGTRGYNTAAIAARGHIYVANDNRVYAFSLTQATPSPTPTATATATASPTPTATATATPTATATVTSTATATATSTATATATIPPTPTPTLSPGISPSPTPTATATASATATATATVTIPPTPTPTLSPGITPSPTPTATATIAPTATPAQAVNLSTRMIVQTGDNAGIAGFIISGTAPKHVLVRAIGPSLTQFGVPNALADPLLELHGPTPFATINNDNWGDDPIQQAAILATGLAPSNNLESAIDATLNPGAYTAIARGKNNSTGVGLVEVFDLSQAVLAKLANISTRAFVNTGDDVVIAGFILGSSNGNDRVVLRGIGPSLAAFGVTNALANPALELRDNNGVLLFANNDWQDDPAQAVELIAAGLAPTNPLESGIASTLPPGLYTALLSGFDNATGIGVVEVYDRGAP